VNCPTTKDDWDFCDGRLKLEYLAEEILDFIKDDVITDVKLKNYLLYKFYDFFKNERNYYDILKHLDSIIKNIFLVKN